MQMAKEIYVSNVLVHFRLCWIGVGMMSDSFFFEIRLKVEAMVAPILNKKFPRMMTLKCNKTMKHLKVSSDSFFGCI